MREMLLLILASGLLGAGYISGEVQPIFAGDNTGIVWGVAGLGLLGTALARRRRGLLIWLAEYQVTTLLGLLGTVLGIWHGMAGMDGLPGPEQVAGAFTALTTTAAGLVAQLWLMLVREATRP